MVSLHFYFIYHFAQIVSQHHVLISYMCLVSTIYNFTYKYDVTPSTIFIIPTMNDDSHIIWTNLS